MIAEVFVDTAPKRPFRLASAGCRQRSAVTRPAEREMSFLPPPSPANMVTKMATQTVKIFRKNRRRPRWSASLLS